MTVCTKALSELADIYYGESPAAINVAHSDIPIFGTSGFVGFARRPLFETEAIIVGRKGTLGNPIYTSGKFWAIDTTYAVLAKGGINTKWLYYSLQNYGLDSLNEATGVPSINRERLYGILLTYFEYAEQCQIAEILSTLDDVISQSKALVHKYQSIKQGLMSDLLKYGIRKDRGLVKTPIGLMPKEWDLETIGSIAIHVGSGATPKGGSTVYLTQGVLFIRSQNVTFDGLLLDDVAFINVKTHERMERSEIFAHDVLLNITGASIGRCCPFPEGFDEANVNQHVCAIRLPRPNRADAIYLSTVLESWVCQSQIETLNAGGNRQGLNYQQLRSFKIPWPKEDERAKIAEIIDTCNSTLSVERNNFEKLSALKQGLMQDLLSGQVRCV